MDCEVLEVPQIIPSVYKSAKQFVFSFAYDTPKVLNDLPDDIILPHCFYLFRRSRKFISSQNSTQTRFHHIV